MLLVVLVGCSNKEYESKDLNEDDIKTITVDMNQKEVLENLGKPLKIWSDDPFVNDELDGAISRDELTAIMLGTESEHKILEERGKKTKDNDNVEMYQYTYQNSSYNDETFLVWIDSNTHKVEFVSPRSFLDENGDTIPRAEKTTAYEDETEELLDEPKEDYVYKLGETGYFDNESGDAVAVTIDSISNFEGDSYHQPEGNYFIKVDFTIENSGSQSIDISGNNFSAYDGDDNKMNMISKDFFKEEIMPGKKASGSTYFDAHNDGPFEIFFADTSWVSDK